MSLRIFAFRKCTNPASQGVLRMSKVQFRITYSIPDGKRPEYLQAISKLREYYSGAGVEYGVFESKVNNAMAAKKSLRANA